MHGLPLNTELCSQAAALRKHWPLVPDALLDENTRDTLLLHYRAHRTLTKRRNSQTRLRTGRMMTSPPAPLASVCTGASPAT